MVCQTGETRIQESFGLMSLFSVFHGDTGWVFFRFGRRSVLIWSYLQLAIVGCSAALSPSYSVYCILRFLCGLAVSGIIINGVSLSKHPLSFASKGQIQFFLIDFRSVCLLYVSVSRGGVDPNQRENFSGHGHLLLLHLWSVDTGGVGLLAERLAEGAVGRLFTPVPLLRLQLVSGNVLDSRTF